MVDYKTLVQFPEGYPKTTTGIILKDGHTVITGHESGLVVRSDLITGKLSAR